MQHGKRVRRQGVECSAWTYFRSRLRRLPWVFWKGTAGLVIECGDAMSNGMAYDLGHKKSPPFILPVQHKRATLIKRGLAQGAHKQTHWP